MSKTYYTTVSHVSPMLTYIPGSLWWQATPATDPTANRYWSQSYHSSNATEGNSRVMFSFFGTGVTIYGGYRQRLGPYQVTLDGRNTTKFDGFKAGESENFDAELFNTTGLRPGYHQLEIINSSNDSARSVLDINRIVYAREVAQAVNISCRDDSMKWGSASSGPPSWELSESSSDTASSSAHMGLNFTGTGISVYGKLHPSSAPFFVAIDGWMSQLLYPNSQQEPANDEPQLLFTRSALLQGNHSLMIRNNPMYSPGGVAPSALSISHMVVFSAEGSPASPGPLLNNTTPIRQSHDVDGPSPATLAGEIAASVLLLILLTVLAFFVIRRIRDSRRGLKPVRPFKLTPRPPPLPEEEQPAIWAPYDPPYQSVLASNPKRSSNWSSSTSPTLFVSNASQERHPTRQRALPKLPRLHIVSPMSHSSRHSRSQSSAAAMASLLPVVDEDGHSGQWKRGDLSV